LPLLPFVFGADVVVLLLLLAGVNVEFDCMDVVDALTAADAVATPARVAAAEAGSTFVVDDVKLEDFPLTFERDEASFSFDDEDNNETPFESTPALP
jgi:polyisoprenoid-binding protein YceI